VALPYECATGTCGTCRARTIEGDVDEGWPQAPGRQSLKPGRGEILMCQASARTDCRLALLDPLGPWRAGAARPAYFSSCIDRLEQLTPDLMGLSLAVSEPMAAEAGQFMLLAAPHVEGFRAYSMAGGEASTRGLDFIVKRPQGGAFTRWLFTDARPDDAVRLFGPLGAAVFEPSLGLDLLLAVGGSGLAPALSILARAAHDNYLSRHGARLFFGIRSLQDATALRQISAWAERFGASFEATVVLSDVAASAAEQARWPALRFEEGMVHEAVARGLASPAANTMAFLAGPPPMVDATRRVLMLKGRLPPSRIRYDKFT
jgi:toluene monooxygenase electron transfer component